MLEFLFNRWPKGNFKFKKDQKVMAWYHAYCLGIIVKPTQRKEHRSSREADGKCWWWKVRIVKNLGRQWYPSMAFGWVEVPEMFLEGIEEHCAKTRSFLESEDSCEPSQLKAKLRLESDLQKAEAFAKQQTVTAFGQ